MPKVLVVEDELLIRLAICEELEAEGCDVMTAPNADEAIRLLESRNDISTIFTDIDMPGSMDGLKLAAAVRDRWPPVNIIVTTGKRPPSDDELPVNSRFVRKPYQASEVLTAIRAFGESSMGAPS
jgi:two-component system, response regulator PdtaR